MRTCVVEGQRVTTREGGSQNEKNPAEAGFLKALLRTISGGGLDVRCLLALRSLYDLEADFLTFLERLESVHLDGREMCKQILAAFIGRDESEAFRVVEPFDRTSCHTNFPCNSCHYHEQFEKPNDRGAIAPSSQAHQRHFFEFKAVEKSASLIVEGLYSAVKNILRRSLTRCKERISRVFPAFRRR